MNSIATRGLTLITLILGPGPGRDRTTQFLVNISNQFMKGSSLEQGVR